MSLSHPTDPSAGAQRSSSSLRGTRLDITAGDEHRQTVPAAADAGRESEIAEAPAEARGGRRTTPTSPSGMSRAYEAASADPEFEAPRHAGLGPAKRLPLIGGWSYTAQRRLLSTLVVLGVLGLIAALLFNALQERRSASPASASNLAAVQSQRLGKVAAQTLTGNSAALDEMRAAAASLEGSIDKLIVAADPSDDAGAQSLKAALPLAQAIQKNTRLVLAQRAPLLEATELQMQIRAQAALLQEGADSLSALKLQQGASAAEVAAVGQFSVLSQRIPQSVSQLMTPKGVDRQSLMLLGKDLSVARALLEAMINGNVELRLQAPRDRLQKERLANLLQQFESLHQPAAALLNLLQPLAAARIAQTAIFNDSEKLGPHLESLTRQLNGTSGSSIWLVGAAALAALLLLLGSLGWLRLVVSRQQERALFADSQRMVAERLQAEARRSNDANQTAILRLMNELQVVAEGDLTQQATVSEDITGAIADSLNYTVEELRSLVAQVQAAASRVTDTTEQVETTSVELLAASSEQLREIRDTGESVLQMAGRIVHVSSQAQLMAHVAGQSLTAAESGSKAVQDAIGGMHAIRDQIQDTAKRIKRLGESSQEIGEITELISDITEQTNVLALNAAIQAASAGEAGRGFSVVAEEVQRLAERSADATRQIAGLVRTIQADTQDAVAAMERSTQGVVGGTRLSDAAGTALADIDGVSRRLSELIAGISQQALKEAEVANVVAANIQHILAVTEQTGEGTRSTAHKVRELSQTADELRQSVARFKIA